MWINEFPQLILQHYVALCKPQRNEQGKTLFAVLFHLPVKKTEKINDVQVDLNQNLSITLGCSMAHALQARTQELILVYKDNLTRNHGSQRLLG